MRQCPYCAQTSTHKDKYGYCRKSACFYRSGMQEKLDYWIRQAKSILFMPDTMGQVSGPVSNFYSHRTRKQTIFCINHNKI